jgi:membrane-bound ClpP family serine protease
MQTFKGRLAALGLAGLAGMLGGCFLAAAGAGAGGAIYVTDRGAEAQVATPVTQTLEAARAAFQEYGITETKSSTEQDGATEKRSLEGKTDDREVGVELRTEGSGTHVNVVVKKTAVTWDKDFAKKILNKIVEGAK